MASYTTVPHEHVSEDGTSNKENVTFYQPNEKCPRLSLDHKWLQVTDGRGDSKIVPVPEQATQLGRPDEGLHWEKKAPMVWIATDPPSPLPPYWSAIDKLPGDLKETIMIEKQKAETKEALEKRKALGWDKVHAAMNNLPRCRVHGTVHPFFLFHSFIYFIHDTRSFLYFQFMLPRGLCFAHFRTLEKQYKLHTHALQSTGLLDQRAVFPRSFLTRVSRFSSSHYQPHGENVGSRGNPFIVMFA